MLTEIQFFGAEKDLWAHRQSWWRSSGDGLCVCKGKGRGWIPCTSGTLILMAISPLGLVSERVACSNGDATLLRLGIEFWGFMLWGCLWVFYCSVGFLCGLFFLVFVSLFSYFPCYFGFCWDEALVLFPFSCWQVPAATPYSRARPISLLNLRRSSAVVLP